MTIKANGPDDRPPLQFPNTPTGPVSPGSSLPVRMITLRDAKVITACLETCMRFNALLLDEGIIATPIGRGELERIIRDLAVDA